MMVEETDSESGLQKFLEGVDFAGTTLISAVRMAAPYVLFMAVILGSLDLLLDRIMPVKVGVVK